MDIVLCAFQLANQIRVGDVGLAMLSSYLTRPSKISSFVSGMQAVLSTPPILKLHDQNTPGGGGIPI